MKKSILFGSALAFLGLAAAPLFAQTSTSTSTTTSTSGFVQSSNIVGSKIKDARGQDVGEIKDVVLDRSSGCLAYVVLSTNGGGTSTTTTATKTVAAPWSVFSASSEPRVYMTRVEREKIYSKHDMTDADGMRLGELEGVVAEEDGYTAESDAAILLDGLDIPEPLHHRKMGELQGGQKVRVLLAQALFGHPQALLLDEPTNNLDLDSIHWLQDFLVHYEGIVIVISHDRHFLNSVCTHIADIDYQTIITYTGGYDDMVMAKTQVRIA